jgi:hypothetical protein
LGRSQTFQERIGGSALPYRLNTDGSKDSRAFYTYAYTFDLATDKTIRSISIPSNRNVLVFAVTLVPGRM